MLPSIIKKLKYSTYSEGRLKAVIHEVLVWIGLINLSSSMYRTDRAIFSKYFGGPPIVSINSILNDDCKIRIEINNNRSADILYR